MINVGYLKRLLSYVFKHYPLLYLNAIGTLFSVATEVLAMTSLFPISALAMHQELPEVFLIRVLRRIGIEPQIRALLGMFVILFSVRIITNLANQALAVYLSKRIQARLSSDTFDMIINNYSVKEIESKTSGHFISLAGDEAARAGTTVLYVTSLFSSLVLSGMYFMAIISYSKMAGIAVIVFMAISLLGLFKSFRKSQDLSAEHIQKQKVVYSIFFDSLNGLRSVRAFGAEEYVTDRYRTLIFDYTHVLYVIEFLHLLSKALPMLVLFGVCGIFMMTSPLSVWLQLDVGFIVTIIVFLMRFFPATGATLNYFLKILADTKAGQDITEIVDNVKRLPPPPGKPIPSTIDAIVLKQINFSHNSKSYVLKDFNAVLKRGNSYAIAGPSGSGKSTLVDLILNFYPLESGDIVVNGMPINEVAVKDLRQRIILLGQQPMIFNDSIFQNISFGTKAQLEDVKRACKLACISDDIEKLSEKYDTVLQYQGSNFSGGQRQRIGIARALLREPDVLILDECTSALDIEVREKIVENILREYKDKIIIFVTHDKAICSKVDHVIEIAKPLQSHQSEAPVILTKL